MTKRELVYLNLSKALQQHRRSFYQARSDAEMAHWYLKCLESALPLIRSGAEDWKGHVPTSDCHVRRGLDLLLNADLEDLEARLHSQEAKYRNMMGSFEQESDIPSEVLDDLYISRRVALDHTFWWLFMENYEPSLATPDFMFRLGALIRPHEQHLRSLPCPTDVSARLKELSAVYGLEGDPLIDWWDSRSDWEKATDALDAIRAPEHRADHYSETDWDRLPQQDREWDMKVYRRRLLDARKADGPRLIDDISAECGPKLLFAAEPAPSMTLGFLFSTLLPQFSFSTSLRSGSNENVTAAVFQNPCIELTIMEVGWSGEAREGTLDLRILAERPEQLLQHNAIDHRRLALYDRCSGRLLAREVSETPGGLSWKIKIPISLVSSPSLLIQEGGGGTSERVDWESLFWFALER